MKKKYLLTVLLSFLFLALTIFMLPIGGSQNNSNTKVPLYKHVKNDPVDGSLSNESQPPTPLPTVAPKIAGDKLVTPKIIRLSFPQVITFLINSNWEYKDYSFTYCSYEDASCEFYLYISYKPDPRYELSVYEFDSEFKLCEFHGDTPSEDPYTIVFDSYQEVHTNFAELRVGKKGNSFVVCQKEVQAVKDKYSGWVAVTDLGFVDIGKPQDYDPAIIGQMISILANTTIEKVE